LYYLFASASCAPVINMSYTCILHTDHIDNVTYMVEHVSLGKHTNQTTHNPMFLGKVQDSQNT